MEDMIAAAFVETELPRTYREAFFAGAAVVFDALENARTSTSVSLSEYIDIIDTFRKELGDL